METKKIPTIDLFAGPGGLGEGFSAFKYSDGYPFRIKLSIEMDKTAHKTLHLRAFYRYFKQENIPVPKEYYQYIAGQIDKKFLFDKYPMAKECADFEAICAELGGDKFSVSFFDEKIKKTLDGKRNWLLLGGPPCQAYSLVGRSRRKNDKNFHNDPKHYLYKEYLRILAKHAPAVFIMENVKGILSSKEASGDQIFSKILEDLQSPNKSIGNEAGKSFNYRIYSLVSGEVPLFESSPDEFIVRCEDYGIPQARHRVIILGIREDINATPKKMLPQSRVPLENVLTGIPTIRSELSQRENPGMDWGQWIRMIPKSPWFSELDNGAGLKSFIREKIQHIAEKSDTGSLYYHKVSKAAYMPKWYLDPKLHATLNHESRSHMASDIHRYFFCACYAQKFNASPKLTDFPTSLLPEHKNIQRALKTSLFVDRFRVQRATHPATTVTSHISKDGHYFIHPDPAQCRSLTVREAARIQTFPDNYFFEGPRTSQYHQVGNAVPPLLAVQIAEIVYDVLKQD